MAQKKSAKKTTKSVVGQRPMMSQRGSDIIAVMEVLPDGKNGFIYPKPRFVRRDKANIWAPTAAIAYGRSCFGGMRIRKDKHGKYYPHYVKTHLRRLRYNGVDMGILKSSARPNFPELRYTYDELTNVIMELFKRNGVDFTYVRPTLFRSGGGLGVSPVEPSGFTLVIEVLPFWDGSYYGKKGNEGMKILIVNPRVFCRPDNPALIRIGKTGGGPAYNVGGDAKEFAHVHDYDDALMQFKSGSEYYVADFSSTNIACISGKTIVFPNLDACLNGITHQIVANIAKDLGFRIEYRDIRVEELPEFDEVFTTGTAGGLTRISEFHSHDESVTARYDKSEMFEMIHLEFKRQILERIEYQIEKMF
jgi:branched-chain amino acid aminotransferase